MSAKSDARILFMLTGRILVAVAGRYAWATMTRRGMKRRP
jgi:hypothetical protein